MSRSLAGSFDPTGRARSAPAAALAPEPAMTLGGGPLRVGASGPATASAGVLCLLAGSLDNAAEIRAELGDVAAPDTPEELLKVAFERWGTGLPERMRGDFVVLLWDEERGEGLIARDQLGTRPLFLHERGGTLLFATEVRHLLAMLEQRPKPDATSLAHWLVADGSPGTGTLYEGIRRLRPAGMLVLDRRRAREERYWRPRFEGPLELPPEQVVTQLRGSLERAVRRQMSSTGRTGVLMSGGLDSSSLAALCARQAPGRAYAYSGTFPDHPGVDESDLIAELRDALGLPGASAEVRPGGLVASALEHLSEWQLPLLGWSDFWTTPLAHAARGDGVGTMLDGTGGDELFGPFSYLLADRLRAGHPRQTLALAYELPGGGAHVPRRQVAGMIRSLALAGALPYRLHRPIERSLARREAPSWLRRRTARDLAGSSDPFAWKRLDGPRWWAYTADGAARGIEAAGVFENQRRWAAKAGLEVRMPLLDLDLVELALRQPPQATFDRRFSRPLLRSSMAGLLPDSVRLRPEKAWFDSLIVDCLAGPDGDAVRALLGDPKAELGAYVDLAAMRNELLDSGLRRESDPLGWMSQVWRLVTAELWLRAQGGPNPGLGLRPSRPSIRVR